MTLKEKVNKFNYSQEVWTLNGTNIVCGLFVGYCGYSDNYSIYFDYTDDAFVEQYSLCNVFETKEDAERELAIRNINQLQNQINAIKKEYNL